MMTRTVMAAAVVCALLLLPTKSHAFDETAGKERLGVRTGGLMTFDGLNDAFGNGWNISLFFSEKLSRYLLLDVRLGALYLGDLKFESLDDQITYHAGIESSMRVLYISVGPMVGRSITTAYSVNASAGAGIYSVSMVFTNVLTPYDLSDQHFGFNGGLGIERRLSTKWNIEANATAHYFFIDKSSKDLYYVFTDGAGSPLIVEMTLGLTLDLR